MLERGVGSSAGGAALTAGGTEGSDVAIECLYRRVSARENGNEVVRCKYLGDSLQRSRIVRAVGHERRIRLTYFLTLLGENVGFAMQAMRVVKLS
jgi:hypothetical protein